METNLYAFIENSICDLSEIHLKMKIGDLSNQDLMLISNLAGKDCFGFIRTVDKFAVRHVFKNHGHETRERLRGQLPVVIEDFLLIEVIIAKYDLVFTETNKLGNIIVHYEKDFDNFRLVYVEEIRNKRREIALQTMYKQKTRKS